MVFRFPFTTKTYGPSNPKGGLAFLQVCDLDRSFASNRKEVEWLTLGAHVSA
jgi:hypothetical protein